MADAVQTDPVLAALIAKLPAGGTAWPAKKRVAWMQLMWGAFELVYEDDGEASELPAFLAPQASAKPAAASVAAPEAAKPATSMYAFYIDKQGLARNAIGDQVMPTDVGDNILYDQRGEGDLGTITWADGTQGISAAGTIAGGDAAAQAGKMQQQAAYSTATQEEQNASQAVASAQRTMLDTQQKTRLAQGTLKANAGVNGVDAGFGSPAELSGELAQRGSYNAAT